MLLPKNLQYDSDEERVLVSLGMKHTIIGVVASVFSLILVFSLGLINEVIIVSCFPVLVLLINIFLLRLKKHNLAPFLGVVIFCVNSVVVKYYYPSIIFELHLIPVVLAVLSAQKNRILLIISIIIMVASFATLVLFNFQLLRVNPLSAINETVLELSLFVLTILAVLSVFIEFKKSESLHKSIISEKNEEILSQKEKIAYEEKKTHELQMQQKHRDLEILNSSNRMKQKVHKNVIADIQQVLKEPDIKKSLKNLLGDLKLQSDKEDKLQTLHDGINDVNYDFSERLKDICPELSKTEREICSYIKLNMSITEIAILRKNSENAIRVTRHRIRKKLKLEADDELESFIESV